jgi:hypothetical protein
VLGGHACQRVRPRLADPSLQEAGGTSPPQASLTAIGGQLYPEPHSPFFDFSAHAEDAAWIDELALRAKAVRDATCWPPTIAHTDWSARNIRIRDHRLVVAYDWDSLAIVSEPVALGQAAAAWNSVGVTSDPPRPTRR